MLQIEEQNNILMIIDKLKRKGFKRSLSLFKEWFEEKHRKSGRFYKWYVYLNEWTDEFQMIELHNFINETNHNFVTYKRINENLFKGMINKKTLPTSFKNKTDAMLHCVINEFRSLENSLLISEKEDKLPENESLNNLKDKAKERKRIQEDKEKSELKKKEFQEKMEARRDKETFQSENDINNI